MGTVIADGNMPGAGAAPIASPPPPGRSRRRSLAIEFLQQPAVLDKLVQIGAGNLDAEVMGAPRVEPSSSADFSVASRFLSRRWHREQRDRVLRAEAEALATKLDAEMDDVRDNYHSWGTPKREAQPREPELRREGHDRIQTDLQAKLALTPEWRFDEAGWLDRRANTRLWKDESTGVRIDGERRDISVVLALNPALIDLADVEYVLMNTGGGPVVVVTDGDCPAIIADQLHALEGVVRIPLGAGFGKFLAERTPLATSAREEL